VHGEALGRHLGGEAWLRWWWWSREGVFRVDGSKTRVFELNLSVKLRVRVESQLLDPMMVFFSVWFKGSSNPLYTQRALGGMTILPYCL
jgi:hypothetical protein